MYRRKYNNRKIVTADGTFDSQKEYKRWKELQLLLRVGAIVELKRQVPYELIPSQRINGKVVERPCVYKADFVYRDTETGEIVVEDTKGVRTTDYIIKRKLMLFTHDIRIKEI